MEEKDEFDMLVDSNTKSLEHRLGNSPEKMEKKVATKKGWYILIQNYIFYNGYFNELFCLYKQD